MIFIHIHFLDDFCSFIQKITPLFLQLIVDDIRIAKQPFISSFTFLFDFSGGDFIDEVEIDRDK